MLFQNLSSSRAMLFTFVISSRNDSVAEFNRGIKRDTVALFFRLHFTKAIQSYTDGAKLLELLLDVREGSFFPKSGGHLRHVSSLAGLCFLRWSIATQRPKTANRLPPVR